ncbi:fibrocystin [Gastrophryne carolinensis]
MAEKPGPRGDGGEAEPACDGGGEVGPTCVTEYMREGGSIARSLLVFKPDLQGDGLSSSICCMRESSCLDYTASPKEGSIAGGTWITILFYDRSLDNKSLIYFGSGSRFEVLMINPDRPSVVCDILPSYVPSSAITCKTRSTGQEAKYEVMVFHDGQPVTQETKAIFQFSQMETPVIYNVSPPSGVPGGAITVFGRLMTEHFEDYDFNTDFVDGPVIMESELDGWFSLCTLADKISDKIYPIHKEGANGTLQCRTEGDFIGSHNMTFSVFNKGRSIVSKNTWHISAKQELFLYQTHSEILRVSPEFGSTGGGTEITVVGRFFQHPAKVTIAERKKPFPKMMHKKGCKQFAEDEQTKDMDLIQMVSSKRVSHHPGNRGLLFELWEELRILNTDVEHLIQQRSVVPNASSPSDILLPARQPFSAVLRGFYVPPETNNYTFWILADNKAQLFFSPSEEAGRKGEVASIPHGILSLTDHWELDWDHQWKQKSPKMELLGGQKYYLEMLQHGTGPKLNMKIGVQIHNTWLSPEVVSTYQREKHQIVARSSRLPEIQKMTFFGEGLIRFQWDNVTSQEISINSSAGQIQSVIEDMLSIHCATELLPGQLFIRHGFEEEMEEPDIGGARAAWTEPYCGRFSIWKPKYILSSSTEPLTLDKYNYVCFAYKGYLRDHLVISVINNTQNTERKNYTCHWEYVESDTEVWKFTCTDLWNCTQKPLHNTPKPSSIYVDKILLVQTENEEKNWYFIDEVIIASRRATVNQTDTKPARPGGHLLNSVSVTGTYPSYNLTAMVGNCGIGLPLIQIYGASMKTEEEGQLRQSLRYGNESITYVVTRLQAASPPIGGTYSIHLADVVITGIPVHISPLGLRKLLVLNADNMTAPYINARDFTITRDLNMCHHVVWTLSWSNMTGDLPDFLQVFAENLTGLDPTVITRVVFDGGVLIWPIFGDTLASANPLPQVTVHVNDIPAQCSGSCAFQHLVSITPVVTDIQYSAGGPLIVLRGVRFDGVTKVEFGSQPCLILSNTSTVITCVAPSQVGDMKKETVRIEIHQQWISFSEQIVYDPLLNPVIVSINPNSSSTTGGRAFINLTNFDNNNNFKIRVTMEEVILTNLNMTSRGIEVLLPQLPTGLYNLSVFINGILLGADGFCPVLQYTLEADHVEPCCGSLLGGSIIIISGKGFSTNASLIAVTIGTQPCEVINSTTDVITCQTPPLPFPDLGGESFTAPIGISTISSTTGMTLSNLSTNSDLIFAYHRNLTFNISDLSWLIENGSLWLNLSRCLSDSIILFENLQYKEQYKMSYAELQHKDHEISLLSFRVGTYHIKIYSEKWGFANITSQNQTLEMFPIIFSVMPRKGPLCGGSTLSIYGLFYKTTNSSVFVKLANSYICTVLHVNHSTIQCLVSTDGNHNISVATDVAVTVIINDVPSICKGSCTLHLVPELTPVINEILPRLDGTFLVLHVFGQRLNEKVHIMVDGTLGCIRTFWNETLVKCHLEETIALGNHTATIPLASNGYTCLSRKPFYFSINPPIKLHPLHFGLNGGGFLTIEGAGLQGQRSTSVAIGSHHHCRVTTSNYTMVRCILPPLNGTVSVTIQLDDYRTTVGTIEFSTKYTPVVNSLLQTQSGLTMAVSGISAVENLHFTVKHYNCTEITGNTSVVHCVLPDLPAENYEVLCLDVARGWATSNITFTVPLQVTSLRNNIDCLNTWNLHILGIGFSPGNTSVTICGSPCQISNHLITSTDLYCSDWMLNSSWSFLCDLTLEDGAQCHENASTTILCDVIVQVGTFRVTKSLAYLHVCNPSRQCDGLSLPAGNEMARTANISGLFISPKVEKDEVLIYIGWCSIVMATEAEMECQAPNQPIITQITAIRESWLQNTQADSPYHFCSVWSQNSSWPSGHPPLDGDNVTVERGRTLLLDGSTSRLNLLHVKGGSLVLLGPGPIHLHAHYILVSEGGKLLVGTESVPFKGKAQITLYGSSFTAPLYPYGIKFLAVRNATISMHVNCKASNVPHSMSTVFNGSVPRTLRIVVNVGMPVWSGGHARSCSYTGLAQVAKAQHDFSWVPKIIFTYLADAVRASSTDLVLEDAVDWRVGDDVVLCAGNVGGLIKQEVLTVTSINGTQLSVRPPLRYSYDIVKQTLGDDWIHLRPIIALLSRDIVIQGNLTDQYISRYQNCQQAGISDITECPYDTSEHILGSQSLGLMFMAQSLKDEPTVVHISGVQFRYTGQAFKKPLSSISIFGNTPMHGSYIQKCVMMNSFARGISLSGVSHFMIKENILYNIKGHGIIVGEHLHGFLEIKKNLLINILGSSGLSNIESLAPAAVYLMSPTNTVEDNWVCSSGYGFFYHLSSSGPSHAALGSFRGNKAMSCTRSGFWIHPEYTPVIPVSGDTLATFQDFTAWKCGSGAQISRCENLSLKDFKIYSCQEFGINITESRGNTTISDSLLLGRLDVEETSCTMSGIITPKRFQLVISNTTFINFDDQTCSALTTCSGCMKGQGGFTIKSKRLTFLNSPRKSTFPFPHCALIEDADGSLFGWKESSLLATTDILPDSCLIKADISGGVPASVCSVENRFHRMSISLNRKPAMGYSLTIINSKNDTSTVNYVEDTLSSLYGWQALLLDKETYAIIFDSPEMRSTLNYSATFDQFENGSYMFVQHWYLTNANNVSVICGMEHGRPQQTLPVPEKNKACDWFYDTTLGVLTYLVAGEGKIKVIFTAQEGTAPPTTAPCPPPPPVLQWSSPKSWAGVGEGWGGHSPTIPQPGDDVIILPNITIVVDIALPPLRGLYVLGVLIFPAQSSNVLNVTCILIAGGELRVGTPEEPLEGMQRIHILLRASEGVHCDRLSGLRVSPGVIQVYGKLRLHSAYSSKPWTHLGADIAPGNEMMALNGTIDWHPGDEIVIASTSYEAHQSELVHLRDIYGNIVRIWGRLKHRHTGSTFNIEDTWRIPLTAEIGLLTHNIQIQADIPCTGRIVVGQSKNNQGEEYIGTLELSNVEISNFGSSPYSAITFTNSVSKSSITCSSIHHICGGGIRSSNSSNILLHSNVIFNITGHGIHIDGEKHTVTDNLLILIRQPDSQSEWVKGIKIHLLGQANMSGNAVAGSERIAYHIQGQNCWEETSWLTNVAHSSLHGLHLYWDDGFKNCTKISGFLCYKNYDYGLVFFLEGKVVVENVALLDNGVGILPIVSQGFVNSSMYAKQDIILQNSLIVATSLVFDCLRDRMKPLSALLTIQDRAPLSPLRGRIGILWPTFTERPRQWPGYPWHLLGSDGAIPGIMKLQDVTFSGFRRSCHSNDGDSCIMSNPESSSIESLIIGERLKMIQIKQENMFYFHLTNRNPECPTSMECSGAQITLFKELDRNLGMSSPVTIFPKSKFDIQLPCFNIGIYQRADLCTYLPVSQGYICQQIDHTIVILENISPSVEPISPVVAITEHFAQVFVNGGSSKDQCCKRTNHTTFYAILPANKITKICFSSLTPKALRLKLHGAQNSTKLILALFYGIPGSFFVVSGGRSYFTSLYDVAPDFQSQQHGSSFFSFRENLLYVILQGNEPVEIWTKQALQLLFFLPPGTGHNISNQMPQKLASVLRIDSTQVTVLQVLQESTTTVQGITDNLSKRRRHCPAIKEKVKRVRRASETKYKSNRRKATQEQESQVDVLIVEISEQNSLPQMNTSSEIVSSSRSERDLLGLSSRVIGALQAGEIEETFHAQIDSVMVIEPDLGENKRFDKFSRPLELHLPLDRCSWKLIIEGFSNNQDPPETLHIYSGSHTMLKRAFSKISFIFITNLAEAVRNLVPNCFSKNMSNAEGRSTVYVRPHSLHIAVQPMGRTAGVPLATQPKVRFLDIKGNQVKNVGHPSSQWYLSAYLKDSSRTLLKGNTTVEVEDGWGNFSNLAVSNPGSNWCLIFNVTSPPGTVFLHAFLVTAFTLSDFWIDHALWVSYANEFTESNVNCKQCELKDSTFKRVYLTAQSQEFQVLPWPSQDIENIFMLVVLSSSASAVVLFLFFCFLFKRNKGQSE